MSLSQEEVKKIAHLARLNLSAEETTRYMSQLSSILNFVEQLKSADTEHIEALAHPLDGVSQRLRVDQITEINLRNKYLSIAPQTEAGLYLVPKVIEEA